MSLTRDEWCKMWESVKKIERLAVISPKQQPKGVHRMNIIYKEVAFIKKQIQSVIGQME